MDVNGRCFGCGAQKSGREFWTIDDRLVTDAPVDALLAVHCEGWGEHAGLWKVVVVCHRCFAALDVDMWISSTGWASIDPRISFDALPDLSLVKDIFDDAEVVAIAIAATSFPLPGNP